MRPVSLRTIVAALSIASVAGCSSPLRQGRADGPFLRAGSPLGPSNGAVPRTPGQWVSAVQYGTHMRARVPSAFSSQQGRGRLPGASLPGIGTFRSVVVPLAIGEGMPNLNEELLATRYFGRPGLGGTLADALARESADAFRLATEVLPVLVNPDPSFDQRPPAPIELSRLVERALASWAQEVDFRSFDNNGPDGVPGSPDDDGVIDMLWVVIEGGHPFTPFTLAEGFELKGSTGRIRTGPIHLLSAPGGVLPDLRIPLDQTLATLGLGPTERFFPAGYPRTVSSVGRARLGWLPVIPLASTAATPLVDGQSMLVPLSDLAPESGFWLVERMRENVFTSRVALRPDAHYQVTDSVTWRRGSEQVLPLSYHLGRRGPTALVRWADEEARPVIHPTGVARAAAPSETAPTFEVERPARRVSAPSSATLVRRAQPVQGAGYRWIQLGQDSVQVAIAGDPLDLP